MEDELKAEEAIDSIIDSLGDVMIGFSEKTEKMKLFANTAGEDLLDLLQKAKKILGKSDVRFVENRSLIDTTRDFLSKAASLDDENDRKFKKVLKLMNMALELLASLLQKMHHGAENQKRPVEGDGSAENNNKKPVLKKVTPKKSAVEHMCRHCDTKFTNPEAYNKHLTKKHNSTEELVEIPKVTCFLNTKDGQRCNLRQPLPMTRHLETHGIKKPNEKDIQMRFFKSYDGGRSFTDVVFLPRHHPDPDPESYIDYDKCVRDTTDNEDTEVTPPASKRPRVDGDQPSSQYDADIAEALSRSRADQGRAATSTTRDAELQPGCSHWTPAPAQEADTAATDDATLEDEEDNLQHNVHNEIEPEPSKSLEEVNNEENVERMEDDENNIVELKIEDLECSDIEEEDQESWAEQVKENRFERYKSRNMPVTTIEALHEKTGNKELIQDFDNFLLNIKQAAKDTHRKAKSWLFTHPKSYLKFQTSKNPQFELNLLTKFEDEKVFVEVSSPIEWQLTEAGPSGQENPSQRKEMLKHHAALRDYILYKLESCELGSSTDSLFRKERIRSNLNNVESQLTRMKIWDKLKKQIQNEKKDKEDLKEARDPDNSTKEANAAKTFFASQKFREMWDKYVEIWTKVQAENKVSKKDFVEFGLWARFLVVLMDKNRNASYTFTNGQYVCGSKLWYPPASSTQEDWNYHEEPEPGRPHDAWQLKLSGSMPGLKGNTRVTVTIEGYAKQTVDMYRDIKAVLFPGKPDPDSPFFCNFTGGPLSPLTNTPGSLLDILGQVTGLEKPTVNSLRRGMESYIQKNEVSRKRINILQGHSESVGLSHYDKGSSDYRSNFIHELSQMEGSSSQIEDNLPEPAAAKRAKLEEEEFELKAEIVEEKKKKSNHAKYNTSKYQKLMPEDREFLQKLFSDEKYKHLHRINKNKSFPGFRPFRVMLYRIIDSEDLEDNDKKRIRDIEQKLFQLVKDDDKEMGGPFDGSMKSNKKADQVIANKIRTSFRVYEKDPKEISYFTFFKK